MSLAVSGLDAIYFMYVVRSCGSINCARNQLFGAEIRIIRRNNFDSFAKLKIIKWNR